MKFKHNHTPWPWEKVSPGPINDGFRIFSDSVYLGFFGNSDMPKKEIDANSDLCSQAPAMRDKLIEVAESMGGQIICLEMAKEIEAAGKLKQELALILEILILASVEVE